MIDECEPASWQLINSRCPASGSDASIGPHWIASPEESTDETAGTPLCDIAESGVRKLHLRQVSFCERIWDIDAGVEAEFGFKRSSTFSRVTSMARSCKGRVEITMVAGTSVAPRIMR